jgi:DNA-directed RNA polymerase sigma subunit (sigma70/sigma32)
MSSARDQVIADIQRLVDSGQALREQLSTSRKGFARGLKLLEDDMPLIEAMAELNSAERRVRMTDLLTEFDECRHRLRLSITAAGLEEGMTVTEIGRAFGVSRQLAARFAKEVRARDARGGTPPPTAP